MVSIDSSQYLGSPNNTHLLSTTEKECYDIIDDDRSDVAQTKATTLPLHHYDFEATVSEEIEVHPYIVA